MRDAEYHYKRLIRDHILEGLVDTEGMGLPPGTEVSADKTILFYIPNALGHMKIELIIKRSH